MGPPPPSLAVNKRVTASIPLHSANEKSYGDIAANKGVAGRRK
jgi:hypothetical protein